MLHSSRELFSGGFVPVSKSVMDLFPSSGNGKASWDGKIINPHRELAKLDLSWVIRLDTCTARKATKACSVKDDAL